MTMPPAGPPPGYQSAGQQHGQPPYQPGPPPGYAGAPTVAMGAQPRRSAGPQSATAIWVLGIISIAGVVLGLSITEDGHQAWDSVNAWGAVAILGAALTLAPVLDRSHPRRAWQTAACGAAALILFWVLFTLPGVGSNTSLLATVGVAAGVIAVWVAPGREPAAAPPQQTW